MPPRNLRLSTSYPIPAGADEDKAGVFVPIMCLANETSITREAASAVTYWHVELDSHDTLFGEGQAVESYLDLGRQA